MKDRFFALIKNETVFVIAGLAAMLSAFFVPVSSAYIEYIDFKVIALLFCLMAVVAGLRNIGTFEVLSQKLLRLGKSVRFISLILVILCFFTAMFVTNDVALLTMVPFTFAVLDFLSEKRIIFIIVMETAAANLGSMLTPVGNPQNLYLFSYFGLNAAEFVRITFPVTLLSLILITAVTLCIKGQKLSIVFDVRAEISSRSRLIVYLTLFLLCLCTVTGILDYRIMFISVIAAIVLTDIKRLKEVDYFLLMTFVFFFVFVGNIAQIEPVREAVSGFIQGRELAASVLLSQLISNVPAAVMLSSFTEDYRSLILGTDIGGLGTLIASLASLISFKLYAQRAAADKKLYMLVFTAVNVLFLAILMIAAGFLI
ncbi:MAG: SLC13 family permease [Anaerovoracaceae bacterium]